MLYTFSKANYDLAWLTQTLAQFDENDIALLWQDGVLQGLTDMNTFPEVELHEVVTLTEYYFPQIAF